MKRLMIAFLIIFMVFSYGCVKPASESNEEVHEEVEQAEVREEQSAEKAKEESIEVVEEEIVEPQASQEPPQASKTSSGSKSTASKSWVIVFTHRGTPLPNHIVNFICDSVKSNVISWLDREFIKYQITRPFDDITCLQDQILLSEKQLLGGSTMIGEGSTFIIPINNEETINFLEGQIPSLIEAKYVTVFHYLVPTEFEFANHMWSLKYDFGFITSWVLPDGNTVFVPPIDHVTSISDYAQELIHEFMHKLGATDKYWVGIERACQINPKTGQEYSGYDIMCHRVSIPPYEGFGTPPITELIISEPTAQEIKKQQ